MFGAGQQRADGAGSEGRLAADTGPAEAGAVEGIPERQGLETAAICARQLEGDLDGVRAGRREQHLGQRSRCDLAELGGESDGRFRGEAARRKSQIIELILQGRDQPGMAVADVMGGIAVKIHITPAGPVLDPDAFGLDDHIETGCRQGLMEEMPAIRLEQRPGFGIMALFGPGATARRQIAVALDTVGSRSVYSLGVHGVGSEAEIIPASKLVIRKASINSRYEARDGEQTTWMWSPPPIELYSIAMKPFLLSYQGAMINTHRDRVRLFPGEVGSRGRCEPHRLGDLTHSGGERTRPRRRLPEAHQASLRPPCDALHRGAARA